jgi:predicted TIM-barrel fold metal-dependent hydrolase
MSDDAPYLATQSWAIGSKQSGTQLDWLFGPEYTRYPGVKIALSEGGIGWMPYFLERAEQVLDKQRFWASESDPEIEDGRIKAGGRQQAKKEGVVDLMTLDIRATFRDHVYGCFIEDRAGLDNIDHIGIDNVMIETDYPHSDSTWPNSIEFAHKQLARFSDDDKYKILRGNAERLYNFTPDTPPA